MTAARFLSLFCVRLAIHFFHFTKNEECDTIFDELNHMKFHVLLLRQELRGKPVRIRRGTAAVREEYRLRCHCGTCYGKTDDAVKPKPEDLLEISRKSDGISDKLHFLVYRKIRTVTPFGVTVFLRFCTIVRNN